MPDIIITTFTDPMMGLSYECEPVYDKLSAYFNGKIIFKYVMSGLVRDVSDFMLPGENISQYNKRLAGIYKSEESIGNLPMNMTNFHLFDENHRSSYPLNIAYKAAQLADPGKADLYLFKLRRATILEGRQTTLDEELISIAREVGINEKIFCENYHNGNANKAFQEDLNFAKSLGIHYLPCCLIQCGSNSKLVNGLIGFDNFLAVIKILPHESSNAPV